MYSCLHEATRSFPWLYLHYLRGEPFHFPPIVAHIKNRMFKFTADIFNNRNDFRQARGIRRGKGLIHKMEWRSAEKCTATCHPLRPPATPGRRPTDAKRADQSKGARGGKEWV